MGKPERKSRAAVKAELLAFAEKRAQRAPEEVLQLLYHGEQISTIGMDITDSTPPAG